MVGSPQPHTPKNYSRERQGDLNSCFGIPVPDIEGSPDTYINSYRVHRVGDMDVCFPQAEGSPNTFTNRLAMARIGDRNAGGFPELTGSPDTFANRRRLCRSLEPKEPSRTVPIPPAIGH